jgi:predicted metal-dependent hydrolase
MTPEARGRLVRLDDVEVRWSPRARHWRLEVPWGKAPRLTVPQGTSHAEVQRLLAEREAWIVEQQRRQVPRLGRRVRKLDRAANRANQHAWPNLRTLRGQFESRR